MSDIPPHTRPAPSPESALMAVLCRLLPQWPLGQESERTQAGLAQALLSLSGERPELTAPGLALALWSWQEHPASPLACATLLRAARDFGHAGHPAARLAARTAPRLDAPTAREHSGQARLLLLTGEHGLAAKALLVGLATPDIGPGALADVWPLLLALEQPDLIPALLTASPTQRALGPELLPLRDRLLAEWAVVHRPPEEALSRVRGLDAALWAPFSTYLEAELLLRLGERQAALALLSGLRRSLPWHANLTLKLHALLAPPPAPPGPEDFGRAAVLTYSWNKADLLESTLAQAAASDTGESLVAVLDNGSTDHTPEVVAAARDRFGADRFVSVRLPVNVGAPAARNWLLSLPEVRARDFAAFLDDDVELPRDWLARLLAAARDNPGAGAVGCRIRAAAPPHFLQSADYNLLPQAPAGDQSIAVFDNCAGTPDLGLFAYNRPAASVSGCCHLLRLDLMERVGGFDVRYTPSQFDDLDRDLRLLSAGRPAFYFGELAARHVQFSSLAKAESPAKMAHVLGNKRKLEAKYDGKAARALTAANLELLRADLERKGAELDDWQDEGEGKTR
jgi:GT2 family glycosyltransferase